MVVDGGDATSSSALKLMVFHAKPSHAKYDDADDGMCNIEKLILKWMDNVRFGDSLSRALKTGDTHGCRIR